MHTEVREDRSGMATHLPRTRTKTFLQPGKNNHQEGNPAGEKTASEFFQ